MPVGVRKRGNTYRVVEAGTNRLARRTNGRPVDGGGHPSRSTAQAQANAINSSKRSRRERRPKR